MILDSAIVRGDLTIVLTGPDGRLKDIRELKNLVVTTGKEFIASRMKDTSMTAMSHMEVGTDNTAAAVGQTALIAAVGSSRTALTSTTVTSTATAYVCTFNPTVGTGALVEAGIFNASSGGTMLCRTVFSVINKGAADTLTITWTITIT